MLFFETDRPFASIYMVNDPRYTVADPRYTISVLHILPSHTFEYRAREPWRKKNVCDICTGSGEVARIGRSCFTPCPQRYKDTCRWNCLPWDTQENRVSHQRVLLCRRLKVMRVEHLHRALPPCKLPAIPRPAHWLSSLGQGCRVVAFFCQNFWRKSLVFGCIGTDRCK